MYVRHGRHGACCPRQLPHRSRARVPFYILQSPFLLSFPYLCFIRMDFLTRLRSDATAPILGKLSPHAVRISPHVRAHPPGRPAVSPPSSSLQRAALPSRRRGQRQHHASRPGQLPHAHGGFALRGRRHRLHRPCRLECEEPCGLLWAPHAVSLPLCPLHISSFSLPNKT